MLPIVIFLFKMALAVFVAMKLFVVALAGVFFGGVVQRIKRAVLARSRTKRFRARRNAAAVVSSTLASEFEQPIDASWPQHTPSPSTAGRAL